VGHRRQSDHEAGERDRGGRVDRGQAEETPNEAVVGGRHRAPRGGPAQGEQPGDGDRGEHGRGDEADAALGRSHPRADRHAGHRGQRRVGAVGERGAQAGQEGRAKPAPHPEVDDQNADRPERDGDRKTRDDACSQSVHPLQGRPHDMRRSSTNR